MGENKLTRNFIIGTFILLYVMVSIISTIHVVDFFKLSNPDWLAVTLAIAFEVGAAASLASIIALRKMNKGIVWSLFFILTAMQAMGNAYYTYVHLENYTFWVELFGLIEEEPIFQKRILSIVAGGILPLVALGFIKSLVDYIKPTENLTSEKQVVDVVNKIRKDNIDVYNKNKNVQKEEESVIEIPEVPKQITEDEKNDEEVVEDVTTDNESDEKKN